MKALYFHKHGDSSVLEFGEVPKPEPQPGEALIKVSAVSLNHLDVWVRRGWQGLKLGLPHIGGSDVVGILEHAYGDCQIPLGSKVVIDPSISSVEDEWTLRGLHSLSPHYKILGENVPGGLAEYVCAPVKNLHLAPQDVNDEKLAASILVGITCWRMLFKQAKLAPGETVLVVGSGGGVNSLSIAMASASGCRVIALAGGSAKADRAKQLGASEVIDYLAHPDWHKEVLKATNGRGVDVVVDNVGRLTIDKSLKAACRGGRIVTVGNTSGYDLSFDNRLLFTKQLSLLGSTMGNAQDFIDSQKFIERMNIWPVVDSVFPLSRGKEALERLEKGEQFGKIVVVPDTVAASA
jgi:NADPH:quinone reductase-like Zn-dependent oxidoreductase